MKIPAVALAAAFGGGIVLGLQAQIGSHINSRLFLIPALLGVADGSGWGGAGVDGWEGDPGELLCGVWGVRGVDS